MRLYYAKSELEDRPVPAIVQEGAETLTATEMLVAVSEMLRDVRLGPMELGLWFRRRPGENQPGQQTRNHHSGQCCEEQAMNQPVVGVPQMLPTQVIDTSTDSREILRHAKIAARRRKLQDWFVVDVDAHHVETVSWNEVVQYIEDPVIRDQAIYFHRDRIGAPPYGLNGDLGLRYQSVGGRIPHQDGLREKVEDISVHRDVTLTRRAMDSLGVDNMVVFPTPMLFLGLHPQPEMEVWLSPRLQQVDAGEAAVGRRPHQVPGRAAVQHAGGVRAHRQGDRRQEGHHRLRHSLDAARAGASQQVHAALPHDRGDRHADLLPRRLSLGRSVAQDRQPLPRHACAGLRLAQHRALHELDPERHPGPLPQAQGDLDRVRASPGRRS